MEQEKQFDFTPNTYIQVLVRKDRKDRFKKKCKEEGGDMSQYLNEFMDYFIKYGKKTFEYIIKKGN